LSLQESKVEKLKKKHLRPSNQMGLARVKTFILENSPAWLVVALMCRFVTKSEYQSKRESITFFQRANVAYGAKRQRRSARLLRVAFGLLGDEIPTSYARLIIGATNQTNLDNSWRGALSSEILCATQSLSIDITDATGWYQLSRGLFSVGYFRAAWVARENSIELSICEGESAGAGANAIGRAIQAHLERRNFADVEALLARAGSQINDAGLCDIHDYLDMMQSKYVMPPLDPNSPRFEAEKLLSELITGKSVALVGPGSPSGHYGNDIDSADTVVRVKFVGREHLPPQEFHGHRCDISWYNDIDPIVSQVNKGRPHDFILELKLVISNPSDHDDLQGCPIVHSKTSGATYRTTSTSGIRYLFQILRSKPKILKIFGYDFYSKIEQYSQEMLNFYKKTGDIIGDIFMLGSRTLPASDIALSFSAHDSVSNFCFAQNLYLANMFKIEPFGASILALTPYQYVERLEEMLGDW
jgi:hypothetical protein